MKQGSLQCSPDHLAGFKGPTSKERGRGREGRGGLPLRGGKGKEGMREGEEGTERTAGLL